NWLAEQLIDFSALVEDHEARSRDACETGIEVFRKNLQALNVEGDAHTTIVDLYSFGDHVARQARTRDLSLIPMSNPVDSQRSVAEAVVFGSGRPVILYRAGAGGLMNNHLETAVVAWDGSRTAARALADAIPLLSIARQVRVLTVLNEKPEAREGLGKDAVRHLRMHGIAAVADETDGTGRKIGEVLESYAAEHRSDLLVMGAFGHSRLREFVLGGATAYLTRNPRAPVFMSH
ncbi:MAG TPA: universal stress protein, partial [Caulobacteraceae bacterium]|nr:universal stress protein [Caulobacteraceae bacterium]